MDRRAVLRRRAYRPRDRRALLGREPDAGGLEWWKEYLAGQLAVLEDEMMDRAEFQTRFYRLFP